ncbi:MAG TPA: cysteine rich repeat-containing protein [Xanthobacteraceae bacterium]|nr:cysteine rich repeat-containing protein [Xanthobacteraceae bacterium]
MTIGSLKTLAAAVLLVTLGTLTSASAQRSDDVGTQNAQNACQGDAYRFCNDAIPDRAKVASCLFRHKRELSAACRSVMGGGGKKAGRAHRGGRHVVHRHRRHR